MSDKSLEDIDLTLEEAKIIYLELKGLHEECVAARKAILLEIEKSRKTTNSLETILHKTVEIERDAYDRLKNSEKIYLELIVIDSRSLDS
jgi:hypothetical protein